MNFSADKIVLVTGASSGIGKAIALECVENGATVLACGRDGQKLAAARSESADRDRWINLERDLGEDMGALPEWVKDLAKKYGRLWGLVCCAGLAAMDTGRTFDLGVSRSLFDINFNAPVLLAKGMMDRRAHSKGGAILFMSSAAAVFPEKGHLLYGSTKAALVCAAKSLSAEAASLGLRVNCISPGIVDTPMEEAAEKLMGPAYREQQLAGYPLGFGKPHDIAEMALFLLSEKARWITGQNIVMAGGRY